MTALHDKSSSQGATAPDTADRIMSDSAGRNGPAFHEASAGRP
jgi:hypothetical protein